MKKIILLSLFIVKCWAQECPTRIGDLEINVTTIEDLKRIFPSYMSSYIQTIDDEEDFLYHNVPRSEFEDEYSGDIYMYELKPDLKNVKSWYNVQVAIPNESTRVLFVPSYKVNDVVIKNIQLRFYNDTLYFIRAGVTKQYREIFLEKYKGKGSIIKNENKPHACKNPQFKKFTNMYSEMFYGSTENNIRAILYLDLKISKDCEALINDKIEIFDFDLYVSESDKIIANIESLKKAQEEKLKIEKQQKLEKF